MSTPTSIVIDGVTYRRRLRRRLRLRLRLRLVTPVEASLLERAIALAVEAHKGQVRKYTGEPYVIHPIRVMLALASESLEVQVAAVLHDVVEDTAVTLTSVGRMFGPEVRRIVDALTRGHGETYGSFVSRIIEAGRDAVIVKMADVRDNMANGSEGRQGRYSKAYERLAGSLG